MSTAFLDETNNKGKDVYLTRFWGGKDSGTMFQVTDAKTGNYIAITEEQLRLVIGAYINGPIGD